MGPESAVIYVDSSYLVKVFRPEPESPMIIAAIGREPAIVISMLTELEVLIQLKAASGGRFADAHQWPAVKLLDGSRARLLHRAG